MPLEGSCCGWPTVSKWGFMSPPSLRTEYLPYLELICMGRLLILCHSFIQSFASVWTCGYGWYAWVIIQHCFIFLLKLSQLWPLGAPVSFSHTPIIVYIVLFFEHFVAFWHFKMYQAHLVYFKYLCSQMMSIRITYSFIT